MKVISGLADVDFNVNSISREGQYLVVRDAERRGAPQTVVYVAPRDIVAALKGVLMSPAALGLILSAPFRRKTGPALAPVASNAWYDEVNNPWL